MLKPIVLATAVSGTPDIVFALVLTLLYGRDPANMLRAIKMKWTRRPRLPPVPDISRRVGF